MTDDLSDCLAKWCYQDEALFDLEGERLFRNNWLLVAHVSDLPDNRDFITFEVAGESAIVIRGNDNRLRAFHNVCRHRGARLLNERSGQCAPTLSCPFHGWTYQLDGNLVGVPAANSFTNLEQASKSLVAVDMEIWMGFIFIRFASGGASLAETMKPLEDRLRPYRLPEMRSIKNSRYRQLMPCNWKVIHDIDNEGYHVPVGHPMLQELYGKNYTDHSIGGHAVSSAWLNDKPAKNWSVRNYQKLLPRFDHLPDDSQRLWFYVAIFPNMVLGLYPDSIEYYMTIPVSPQKTILTGASYALPDARRGMDAVRWLNLRINRITSEEDVNFVMRMHNGMKSSAFPEPELSSLESGVREFHHKIQSVLPVTRLKQSPGAEKMVEINNAMTDAGSCPPIQSAYGLDSPSRGE